jgi:hypothetical protein
MGRVKASWLDTYAGERVFMLGKASSGTADRETRENLSRYLNGIGLPPLPPGFVHFFKSSG